MAIQERLLCTPLFVEGFFVFGHEESYQRTFLFYFFVTLFNGTKIFVFPNDVYLMALFNKDRIPSGSLLMSAIL